MAHYPGVIFNVATNPASYHKWSPLKNNYNIARIKSKPSGGGEWLLPIMAYTGMLHPKGVPFSGFRYIKG